jgi:hypothetical protein
VAGASLWGRNELAGIRSLCESEDHPRLFLAFGLRLIGQGVRQRVRDCQAADPNRADAAAVTTTRNVVIGFMQKIFSRLWDNTIGPKVLEVRSLRDVYSTCKPKRSSDVLQWTTADYAPIWNLLLNIIYIAHHLSIARMLRQS